MATPSSADPALEAAMADLGRSLGTVIRQRGEAMGRVIGFALLTFDMGKGGHLAYVSNADRGDMVRAMKEFIAKVEAQ